MHTLPDILGDDAVHSLGAPDGARAVWVQFTITGTGTCRVGDSFTSSTRGLPVDAGTTQFLPYKGRLSAYALDGLKVYVPTGATVSVAYANQ